MIFSYFNTLVNWYANCLLKEKSKSRMKKLFLLLIINSMFIVACTRNAITGRSQLSLIPESTLQQEAVTQYRSFLNENHVVSVSNNKDAEMVTRVGKRIAAAITKYYSERV